VTAPGPALSVTGLVKRYDGRAVVDGVSFEVRTGTVLALLGPNGAGKSTTVEVCEGFRTADEGEVRVLGLPPTDASLRPRVGVMPQTGGAYPGLRCGEMLRLVASYAAHPLDPDDLLERLGLVDVVRTAYRRLSGGQQQRLSLALAVVGRPELLFLDEPTAGLDPQGRHDVHELVHRLADLEGTTVLLTTHDLAEAERLSDRILVLAAGRIVADGSADALAREVAGTNEVRWSQGGERFVHPTDDATEFVRRLLTQNADVEELEVRRASLEDTYLEMVRRHEQPHEGAVRRNMEVVR